MLVSPGGRLLKNICFQLSEILSSLVWGGSKYCYFYKLPRWLVWPGWRTTALMKSTWSKRFGFPGIRYRQWCPRFMSPDIQRPAKEAGPGKFPSSQTIKCNHLSLTAQWPRAQGFYPGYTGTVESLSWRPRQGLLVALFLRWLLDESNAKWTFIPSFLKIESLHLRNQCPCFIMQSAAKRSRSRWMSARAHSKYSQETPLGIKILLLFNLTQDVTIAPVLLAITV